MLRGEGTGDFFKKVKTFTGTKTGKPFINDQNKAILFLIFKFKL